METGGEGNNRVVLRTTQRWKDMSDALQFKAGVPVE